MAMSRWYLRDLGVGLMDSRLVSCRSSGEDPEMPAVLAALWHNKNVIRSRAADWAPLNCSLSVSARPRSPASSASRPGRECLACRWLARWGGCRYMIST
jgi:hypothetical protein